MNDILPQDVDERRELFGRQFLRLYRPRELKNASLTLAAVIFYFEKKDKICKASEKSLAKLAGLSVSAVNSHLLRLANKQYIIPQGQGSDGIPMYTVDKRFAVRSKKEIFLPLPLQIVELSLDHACKRLYAAVLLRAGIYDEEHFEGFTTLGAGSLAKDAGISERHAKRRLDYLVRVGLFRRSVDLATSSAITTPLPFTFYHPPSAGDVESCRQGDINAPCPPDFHECPPDVADDKLEREARTYKQAEPEREPIKNAECLPGSSRLRESGCSGAEDVVEDVAEGHHPATGEEARATDKGEEDHLVAVVDELLGLRTAREVHALLDDLLGVLVASIQAKRLGHPASVGTSPTQINALITETLAGPRDNPVGFLRNLLRQGGYTALEDYVWGCKAKGITGCLPSILRRLGDIKQILQPQYDAEIAKLEADEAERAKYMCVECGKKKGRFLDAFNAPLCYDPWVGEPNHCTSHGSTLASKKWNEAKNHVSAAIWDLQQPTVHKNVIHNVMKWLEVLSPADQLLDEKGRLRALDRDFPLAEHPDPEALARHVDGLYRKFAA